MSLDANATQWKKIVHKSSVQKFIDFQIARVSSLFDTSQEFGQVPLHVEKANYTLGTVIW